ncbi:MAG: DUF1573 domain-containing protein [Rikenellaceae bacterium]
MLKNLFLLIVALSLLTSCFSGGNGGDSLKSSQIELDNSNESKTKLVGQIIMIEKPKNELYNDQYTTLLERNLGTIGAGETISGVLNFSTSADSLTIIEMKGTCGCMTLEGSFKELNNGEVARVNYTINTSGKEGEEYFDIIIDSSLGKFIVEMKAFVK